MGVNNLDKSGLQFFTEALWDKIKSRQGLGYYDGTPVGTVISYMGKIPPEGYLACDGSVYNFTLYPELVKHIKDNFGRVNFFGGDGVNTFAVPDLRGEFLRGAGMGARDTGSGLNVGVHQDGTQHVNVMSALSLKGSGNRYSGIICKDNDSEKYLNSVQNYDFSIDSTENTLVHDSFLAKVSTYEGNDYKNMPVRFGSRPTNTSILYCIKCYTNLKSNLKTIESLTNFTSIPANSDLKSKSYIIPGNYCCESESNVVTLKNCPVAIPFTMIVSYADGKGDYIMQEIRNRTGKAIIKRSVYVSTMEWGPDYRYMGS